jgi:deoxyribodipyrimidine photolyase
VTSGCSTAVVLFTRDLRVHDQPASSEAARTNARVAPLFVFDDALLRQIRSRNVGDWQWVVAMGVDSRPNRVLNPIAQAKRLDPHGAYVRRHVPELAEREGAAVHQPWRAPLACALPDYPDRIVDHAEATVRFRRQHSAEHATRA